MRARMHKNFDINHSLTPALDIPKNWSPPLADLPVPKKQLNPLNKKQTYCNPLKQRSRKHRLIQQKNTDIQRQNRRLYQKLRKIKIKNTFQSETKIQSADLNLQLPLYNVSSNKPMSLPQLSNKFTSFNSTKSQLSSILTDRKTFVEKYFQQLKAIQGRQKSIQQLGNYVANGWKIKAILIDGTSIVLRGIKNTKQLTKKYNWQKIKLKIKNGLQQWAKMKFQFQQ